MKVERLIEGLSPEKDFLQQVLREVRNLLAAGNKRKNLIENKIIRYVMATLFSCFDGISMTIRDESKQCCANFTGALKHFFFVPLLKARTY